MVATVVVEGVVRESDCPGVGIRRDVLVGGLSAIGLEDAGDGSVFVQSEEVIETPLANGDVRGSVTVTSKLNSVAERTEAGHLPVRREHRRERSRKRQLVVSRRA